MLTKFAAEGRHAAAAITATLDPAAARRCRDVAGARVERRQRRGARARLSAAFDDRDTSGHGGPGRCSRWRTGGAMAGAGIARESRSFRSPATLFLAPVVTSRLLGFHSEVLGCLGDEIVDPHYRSDHWVPHVTLGSDLTDPGAGVTALATSRLPVIAVLKTLEVMHFRPVEILASHLLLQSEVERPVGRRRPAASPAGESGDCHSGGRGSPPSGPVNTSSGLSRQSGRTKREKPRMRLPQLRVALPWLIGVSLLRRASVASALALWLGLAARADAVDKAARVGWWPRVRVWRGGSRRDMAQFDLVLRDAARLTP